MNRVCDFEVLEDGDHRRMQDNEDREWEAYRCYKSKYCIIMDSSKVMIKI